MQKATAAVKEKIFYIQDAWKNILAGFGTAQDKTKHSIVDGIDIIRPEVLGRIWTGEGLGKRIVTLPADDMTRAGFSIKGDDKGVLLDALKGLGIGTILRDACYWQRLFSGALIVADVESATDLSEPLEENHGPVVRLRVFDATRVRILPQNFYADTEIKAGLPEKFTVTAGKQGGEFTVHESRCAWITGEPIPDNAYMKVSSYDVDFWGMSALQAIMDKLAAVGTTDQAVANLLMEATLGVFKMGELSNILAENDSRAFWSKMTIIASSKSAINMVLLGQDEDFKRDSISFNGVPDTVVLGRAMLSAVSGIPYTKLFNLQQSGLQNSDSVSLQNYYTDIESKQEAYLLPPITKLAGIVNAGLDKSVLPKDKPLQVTFNPVWEPSASDKVELMAKWAASMKTFWEMGVLSSEEIRQSTFGQGRITFNVNIDTSVDVSDEDKELKKQAKKDADEGMNKDDEGLAE